MIEARRSGIAMQAHLKRWGARRNRSCRATHPLFGGEGRLYADHSLGSDGGGVECPLGQIQAIAGVQSNRPIVGMKLDRAFQAEKHLEVGVSVFAVSVSG